MARLEVRTDEGVLIAAARLRRTVGVWEFPGGGDVLGWAVEALNDAHDHEIEREARRADEIGAR